MTSALSNDPLLSTSIVLERHEHASSRFRRHDSLELVDQVKDLVLLEFGILLAELDGLHVGFGDVRRGRSETRLAQLVSGEALSKEGVPHEYAVDCAGSGPLSAYKSAWMLARCLRSD